MSKIHAVVVRPEVPGRLSIEEVDAPIPNSSDALVRVEAISLNRGEVNRSMRADAGWRPGWDLAGVVTQAASDGSGPRVGARVVGMLGSGAWAQTVAINTNALTELSDSITFEEAATLPVAGLTALYTLERGGQIIGKPILITGATGGVGYFATQIARASGAYVVGAFRNAQQEKLIRQAGAHEVVIGEDLSPAKTYGPYSLILESVGGSSLTSSLGMLALDGTCVLYGTSAEKEVTFNAQQFYGTGGASLYGFILFHELHRKPASVGLKQLTRLMTEGIVKPHISVQAPWEQIADIAKQLLDRSYPCKAVLNITH